VVAASVTTFEELLELARDKSVAARSMLAETVSEFFFDDRRVLTERERALMIQILRQLIHDVEMSVRRTLAERLADQPSAPPELVLELANAEIEAARPILARSEVLRDPELIEIIRHRTLEHRLAIALRKSVSEAVSDALVETNDTEVISALLNNTSARISKTTLEYLVEESRRIDHYQNPLLHRDDLPRGLAERMYWWVSAALRKHILEKFSVDPTELDDTLERTIQSMVGGSRPDNKIRREPNDLADALVNAGYATPKFIVKVLREGEIPLFEAIMAKLTGLRVVLVRRFVYEPGGEALAVACRAIDIEKAAFAAIFILSRRARPGEQVVEPDEVNNVLAFYDRLDVKAAKRMLRRWQREPDYLDAIRRVDLPAEAKLTG
jgi:uncharacterized protein (DUF2336 family)